MPPSPAIRVCLVESMQPVSLKPSGVNCRQLVLSGEDTWAVSVLHQHPPLPCLDRSRMPLHPTPSATPGHTSQAPTGHCAAHQLRRHTLDYLSAGRPPSDQHTPAPSALFGRARYWNLTRRFRHARQPIMSTNEYQTRGREPPARQSPRGHRSRSDLTSRLARLTRHADPRDHRDRVVHRPSSHRPEAFAGVGRPPTPDPRPLLILPRPGAARTSSSTYRSTLPGCPDDAEPSPANRLRSMSELRPDRPTRETEDTRFPIQ